MSEKNYRQLRRAAANDVPKTIKRTFAYISNHNKTQMIWALICVLITSLTGVVSSYFFTPIINDYVVPCIGQENPDLSGFIRMLVLMAAVYIIGVIASYTFRKLISLISTGILHDMRTELFNKMQKLPVRKFDSMTHGEMMVYFTNDIDTIRPMIADGLPAFLNALITLVGCFVMMMFLNVKLTLVSLLLLGVIALTTTALAKASRRFFANLQKEVSNVNGYVEEMFSGQKVIKVFNHEKEAVEDMKKINDRLYQYSWKTNAFAGLLFPVNANIAYIGYAVIAVLGAKLLIEGEITIGVLASFLLYVRQFTGPVTNLSQQFNGIMMSLAGAERVFDLLDEEEEPDEGVVTLVKVRREDDTLVETDETTHLWAWKIPADDGFRYIEVKGDVRLNHVNFGYTEDKLILHDISLYAKPGQKIAFVGSTGAGKTTITNLLNRFYDVNDGTITFDGIPVNEIKKDDLRRSIGMVLQDTNLFSGTVMDNIRYGRLDATDEECIAAARRCNASSFIERLPHGYQTMLSSNGSNLSQGQRQLLNIARCAVADPPVMILDEATSSIDTHTEKLIEKGMDELMNGRTTFVIAHRLSTVRNANAIIVLEQGSIIERGDHEDLLKEKGRYYQLYTGKAELD